MVNEQFYKHTSFGCHRANHDYRHRRTWTVIQRAVADISHYERFYSS